VRRRHETPAAGARSSQQPSVCLLPPVSIRVAYLYSPEQNAYIIVTPENIEPRCRVANAPLRHIIRRRISRRRFNAGATRRCLLLTVTTRCPCDLRIVMRYDASAARDMLAPPSTRVLARYGIAARCADGTPIPFHPCAPRCGGAVLFATRHCSPRPPSVATICRPRRRRLPAMIDVGAPRAADYRPAAADVTGAQRDAHFFAMLIC